MGREATVGMSKGFWVAAIVLLLALMGSIGVVGYLLGKQAKPESEAPVAGPVMAPSGEPGAPEKPAPVEKPAPASAPAPAAAAPQGELRIVDGPDGVVITDGNREGTIVRKGHQILLLLHQEKGPPSASPSPPPPAAAPPAPASPKKSGASEADAVREYFLRLATLQRGPVGVGPQQFAERLTGNLAQGNTADFDELVSDAEKAYDEVRKLTAPEPCREIHKTTLGVMKDSVDILRDLRDAVVQKNISELQALEGRARQLMSRVKDLDRQQAVVREKFGIY